MTTSELLRAWMRSAERGRIKPRTYARYKSLIDIHIDPSLGEEQISEITRRKISAFLAEKRRSGNKKTAGDLSPVSINLMLSILNMAFEYACESELIKVNPCDRIKRLPVSEGKQIDAFTKEEQRRLEQTIESEGDGRCFGVILCFYTGLRIGELLGLEWSDLNEECDMLTVSKTVYRSRDDDDNWRVFEDRPKTPSSNRTIPLPEHISKELSRRRAESGAPFIVANKKGERMSIRSYQYIFEKLTERAEVRKLNFHAIRHTFATRALERGVDIKTLSELMGHKNATLTLNRYAHSMMDTKIEMMKRMTRV